MIIILLSALVGVLCAIAFDLYASLEFSAYLSVLIIAAIDSVMGAYKSFLSDEWDVLVFGTGFFGNSILSALMVFLGHKIGLDLYYAVIIVFTYRIFTNFSFVRREWIKKIDKKLKKC